MGPNLYRYVADNPVSFVDPFGLWQLGISWTPVLGSDIGRHGDLLHLDDNGYVVEGLAGTVIGPWVGGSLATVPKGQPSKDNPKNKWQKICGKSDDDPEDGLSQAQERFRAAKARLLETMPWLGQYNFLGVNSNTVLYKMIEEMGYNPPTPDVFAPGYFPYTPPSGPMHRRI